VIAIARVDCSPPDQLLTYLYRGPVVVIIDDVDAAVIDASAGGGGSGSSLTPHGLALLRFCRFLTFSSPHVAVVVIATCSAKSAVAASPLGGIGLFDAPIQLTEPSAHELVAIASAAWSERGIQVDADVEALCFKGYTLSEIDTVIERTCTSALTESRWPESGIISPQIPVPRISAATISAAMSGWVSAGVKNAGVVQSSSSLEDVGGMLRVKSALFDMLSFQTQHSELFASAPVRVQTGMLLYGYPGCGKTMIVGAACKSVGLPLIVVQGPEILNKYIGASESEVRRVFDRARAVAPCVLFFDEFDAISRRRGHDNTGVTDRVVNQLLTSLDGFEVLKNVFVIAATSRPDIIDPALLRPGRLDTHLLCDLPDVKERADVLRVACKSVGLSAEVDLAHVAGACEGMTYADVNALVYSAQLHAATTGTSSQEQQPVTAKDFEAALTTTPLSLPQQVNAPNRLFARAHGACLRNARRPRSIHSRRSAKRTSTHLLRGSRGEEMKRGARV
jgi:peroxin-1